MGLDQSLVLIQYRRYTYIKIRNDVCYRRDQSRERSKILFEQNI